MGGSSRWIRPCVGGLRALGAAARRVGPSDALLRRALVILIGVKIAGMILVFSPSGLSAFDLPKTVWSRAAGWLILGVLAVVVARAGFSAFPRSPVHFAVAALVLANLASTATALHTYTALFGERTRYLGFSFLLDMAVLYAAASIALRSARDRGVILAAVGVAAGAAITYAAIQALRLDPIDWSDTRGRAFATFGNADVFGHFLAAIAGACGAIAAFGRGRVRAAAGGLLAAALAIELAAATRGALVGFAGAGLAVAILYLRLHGLRRGTLVRVGAVGVTLLVGLAAAAAATPLGARLAIASQLGEYDERLFIARGSAQAFLARPLLGSGPDSLGVIWPSVREVGTEARFQGAVAVDQAHDWILHSLATTGIVGTAALTAFIVLTFVELWRAFPAARATAAALIGASAAYWSHALLTIEAVGIGWIPWLSAAAAAALGGRFASPAPRAFPAWGAAAIAAVAIALAVTAGSAARANDAMARGRLALLERNAGALTDAANEALAFDPGRGEYWNYRGIGRNLRGLFGLAAADYEEAASRTPHQTNFLGNLARARASQALAGDTTGGGNAAAYAAARRAIAVDPNLSSTHRALADVALAFGDHELALSESLAAVRLHPGDAASDATIVAAALAHTDRSRAHGLVDEILRLRQSETLLSARARLAAP